MKAWLVFDRKSAEAARAHSDDVEEMPGLTLADALEQAVRAGQETVVVVPAGGDRATVARITPPIRPTDE